MTQPAQPGVMTAEQIEAEKKALGPNATTEAPKDHYFELADGTKVNAWGEVKGSAEDKKRNQ